MVAHVVSNDAGSARLALCGRGTVQGAVDGAWWPHTADLNAELPDLITVVGSWIGPIRRVVYDPGVWSSPPSRVIRGHTVTTVDPYQLVASDTIYLMGTHARDAVLFVVPPATASDTVRRVLRAVSDATQPMSARALRLLVDQLAAGAKWIFEPSK